LFLWLFSSLIFSETSLASFSVLTTCNISQIFGTASNQQICATHDGARDFSFLFEESVIALTFQTILQVIKISFCFKVQVFNKIVATGHKDLSRFDSIIVAIQSLFGFALSSLTSATKRIVSSKFSIHFQFFAETSTKGTSHPQSSGITQSSESSHFTFSGLYQSTSDLFKATIKLTQDSLI
jgi:hypothetical protein